MTYGNIYVARVAMGAKDEHTLKAFLEAEAYDGPALIIAYSHCIAHGINMTTAMQNQKAAVNSGQWLLYRYNPTAPQRGENPLQLDSPAPRIKVGRLLQARKPLQDARPRANRTTPRKLLAAGAGTTRNTRWRLLRISRRARRRTANPPTPEPMNLTTTYLGLKLRTPLVPSASPLSEKHRQHQAHGGRGRVGGRAFIRCSRSRSGTSATSCTSTSTHGTESYRRSADAIFPSPPSSTSGRRRISNTSRKPKQPSSIPIIASLNGSTFGGWTSFARQIEQAGADALELNIYSVPDRSRQLPARKSRRTTSTILAAVKAQVKIPVAVKLSPFFTNFANIAQRLRRRRRRPRALQSLLPAGHRTRDARSLARTFCSARRWRCGCRCAGLRSSTTGSARASPPPAAFIAAPMRSRCSWPART